MRNTAESGRKGFSLEPEKKRFYLRVGGLVLGTFVLGYLFTMVIFFPGWGREAIVTVPDLRGRPLAAARRAADDAGLELVRRSTLSHATVPAGAVLAQSPLPGQEVTRGEAVRVIVSTGPDRRPIPQVDDLRLEQAQLLLERTGFRVQVARVHADRPLGRILEVQPAVGTAIPAGSVVRLTVSAGPPLVSVPSVAGMQESAAADALRDAGLRVGEVSHDPASAAAPGEVVAQEPAAGAGVPGGSRVRITVSGSPPVVEAPPVETPPDTTAPAPPPPPQVRG